MQNKHIVENIIIHV